VRILRIGLTLIISVGLNLDKRRSHYSFRTVRSGGIYTVKSNLAVIIAAIVVCCVFSCDKYNVVEPRFYSEDDIVNIPVCEGIGGKALSLCPEDNVIIHEIPPDFYLSMCWLNKAERTLFVYCGLPTASYIEIHLLGSSGYVVQTLIDSSLEAGMVYDTLSLKSYEDGVYAIRMNACGYEGTVWFEIE
jgi:hypothetical protein